jgi:hypothetical protein
MSAPRMVVLFVLGELVLSSLAGGEFQQPAKSVFISFWWSF